MYMCSMATQEPKNDWAPQETNGKCDLKNQKELTAGYWGST